MCAFFLPEYYSRWQDGQLLGQVSVEGRQMTHLPEETDKPVAEKIRQVTEIGEYLLIASYDETTQWEEALRLCARWKNALREQVGEWVGFGLLSEGFLELFENSQMQQIKQYDFLESGLSLLWMQFAKEDVLLNFIMDTDGICLYYVSYCRHSSSFRVDESPEYDWIEPDGNVIWRVQTLAQKMADESFQLKEYCQASYVQRWTNGNTVFGMLTDSSGNGSVVLLYDDFSAEATAFRIDLLGRENRENEVYLGHGILLGSGILIELVVNANRENGWLTYINEEVGSEG